ncbi:MAG: glycosyltransferase [Candidatus Hydrogenedentota bacterium]|nr:MAG: glycosyltransferase [Candidatus Hydrogenedentota bacterium]
MEILIGFLILVYAVDILALFYFGLHCYAMVWLFKKNGGSCYTKEEDLSELTQKMGDWPMVTIQLPMYNEYYVAERVIDATANLDYPKDKLYIQVLDDSTDETKLLVEKKVAELKKQGFDIEHIHRTNRQGHKAGALKEAMDKAKGEFLAIFDADFIPAKDFLKKTVPYFWAHPKMGMVQTRWGHINADYSLLTKAQSIGIDGHFIIEQVARNGSNLWMNFNGTAGIWRKECIIDAGNWSADTLTEDFDLSYRAELKGWKFKYLTDIINPAELPATVSAYKSQQFRWCKGSIQTAVKLIPKIWKSNENWKIKLEAITHLLNYSVHPLMVINILATLPLLLFNEAYWDVSIKTLYAAAFFLSIGTFGPMYFYMISQKALYKDWKRRIQYLPLLTVIGTGIAINNTKAWLEALIGKKSSFVRTPKLRLEKNTDKVVERSKYTKTKIDKVAVLEFLMGVYVMLTIAVAIDVKKYFVIPFLVLYATGFFYVSFFTVYEKIKHNLLAKKAEPAQTASLD